MDESEPRGDRIPEELNLVLEGGGVKGIALVGALCALDETLKKPPYKHTRIVRMAGTSAGAIVASLLAAGYAPGELREIVGGPEIAQFAAGSWLGHVPFVGKPLDLAVGAFVRLGAYRGDHLQEFIREKLLIKGIRTFGDIWRRHGRKDILRMIATDLTRGRMLVLPDGLKPELHGYDMEEMEVALAVRMSFSVPFVFAPVRLRGEDGVMSYIVDGGVLSNFPIHLFDDDGFACDDGPSLTIGVKIISDRYHAIDGRWYTRPLRPLFAAYALASTAVEAHDVSNAERLLDARKSARVIVVNTDSVSVFRFDLSPLEKEALFNAGYELMTRQLDLGFLERATYAQQIAARTPSIAGNPAPFSSLP